MLKDEIFLHEEGKGACAKTKITRVTTFDAAVVRSMAQYERDFGKNGWADARTHRVIGEIPLSDFLDMQRRATTSGDVVTGEDLKRYLRKNPEYLTVNGMNAATPGRVVV